MGVCEGPAAEALSGDAWRRGSPSVMVPQSRVIMGTLQDEIDRNYSAFLEMLPNIIATHREQYALMKDGKIIGFFITSVDARTAAEAFIKDKLYSIQKVTDSAIDLGYFSHAVHSCTVQS
jgi:hypothetical protein